MGKNRDVLVIGLGRFGRPLAESLESQGHDVLGVDDDEDRVQSCSEALTRVVRADARDQAALRQLGSADFPIAVVAIGTDIEASMSATFALSELKVPSIWARALTEEHGEMLRRIGATRVVFPERAMGIRVAHSLIGRALDYVALEDGFVIIETTAPSAIQGRPLAELDTRKRLRVNVLCVKRPGERFVQAMPETVITADDILLVAGLEKDTAEFARLS